MQTEFQFSLSHGSLELAFQVANTLTLKVLNF